MVESGRVSITLEVEPEEYRVLERLRDESPYNVESVERVVHAIVKAVCVAVTHWKTTGMDLSQAGTEEYRSQIRRVIENMFPEAEE